MWVNVQHIVLVILSISVMVSMGISLDTGRLRGVFVRERLILWGVLLNLVAVPIFAFALARILSLNSAEAFALLLCAAAPGGGTGTLLTKWAKGDTSFSVALLVPMTLLSLVVLPLVVGGLRAELIGEMFVVLVKFQFLPLWIGVYWKKKFPVSAAKGERVLSLVGSVLLLLLIAGIVAANTSSLLASAPPFQMALVLLVLVTLLPGMFLKKTRSAFSLTSGVRNLTLALLASTVLSDVAQVQMAVLQYGLVMFASSFVAVAYFKLSRDSLPSRR